MREIGDTENPLVGHLGLELQGCQLTDLSNHQSIGDWISNKETRDGIQVLWTRHMPVDLAIESAPSTTMS